MLRVMNIFFDVDDTLVTWDFRLRPHVRDVFQQLRRRRLRSGQGRLAQQLTQRNETGILPIALAGMNSTLEHEQRDSAVTQCLRSQFAGARYQQRAHRSALGRLAVYEGPNGVRPALCELFAERFHLIETACLTKIGSLGKGRQHRISQLRDAGLLARVRDTPE